MANIECISGLIGLAQCACPCIEDGAPENWDASPTGLFIDGLFPIGYLTGFDNCGSGSIWDVLQEARRRAAADADKDLSAFILSAAKDRRPPFNGAIGKQKSRSTKPVSKTYAGARMLFNPLRSAKITLTGITSYFDFTGELTLMIYDGRGEQVGDPVNLTTTANRAAYTPLSIDLVARSPYGAETLYFVYEVAGNPLHTSTSCGCGKPYQYNEVWPDTNRNTWENWVNVSGWSGDTVTDFDAETLSPAGITDVTNGLVFHITANCDTTTGICDDVPDLTKNSTQVLSKAVQFKAAAHLAEMLLTAKDANRYAIINREQLNTLRREWADQYVERIKYLVSSMNYDDNDCICHRGFFNMKTKGVMT